jgi:hypothetical protein
VLVHEHTQGARESAPPREQPDGTKGMPSSGGQDGRPGSPSAALGFAWVEQADEPGQGCRPGGAPESSVSLKRRQRSRSPYTTAAMVLVSS